MTVLIRLFGVFLLLLSTVEFLSYLGTIFKPHKIQMGGQDHLLSGTLAEFRSRSASPNSASTK